MLGSQMYNNKHHRIAQKSFQEGLSNVQDYLSNVGKKAKDVFEGFIPKNEVQNEVQNDDTSKARAALEAGNTEAARPHLENLIESGVDIAKEFGLLLGGELAAYKLFTSMNLNPAKGPGGVAGFVRGGRGMLGAEGAMNIIENIKGDIEIYKDYHSDYNKDLDALSELYPQNQDLQELIKVMRVYADDGLKALIEAKSKKANKRKNYKIAIVGDANWRSYGHQGFEGVGMGLAAGGGLIGAGIGGLGMALADASKDVFHNLQSDEYKAAAYTHELVQKAETMVNQIAKYDSLSATKLKNIVEDFDRYVRKYIYKEKDVEEPKNLTGYLEKLKNYNNRNI
jgi:hypothetical protein